MECLHQKTVTEPSAALLQKKTDSYSSWSLQFKVLQSVDKIKLLAKSKHLFIFWLTKSMSKVLRQCGYWVRAKVKNVFQKLISRLLTAWNKDKE